MKQFTFKPKKQHNISLHDDRDDLRTTCVRCGGPLLPKQPRFCCGQCGLDHLRHVSGAARFTRALAEGRP